MEIHTWVATDAETNPAKAIAMIRMPMEGAGGPGRKIGLGWALVWFHGVDAAEARQKAQDYWDAEMAKNEAKKPRGRPKMERPVGTPADDIEESV